jgi:hypothetical protein
MEAQILVLRSEFEAEESDALKAIGIEKARIQRITQDRAKMAKNRKSDVSVAQSARTKTE